MNNIYDFSTDRINIFSLLIDSSGSMEGSTNDMIKGLEMYKKSFSNFSEANSMAISVNKFNSYYYSSAFRGVDEFEIDYSTGGGTAIYYSICVGADQILEYVREVTEKTGCVPRATFIVFSDGEPCGDTKSRSDAKEAIEKLNYAGVTTVFVAFGGAIDSKFGDSLGFVSTIDVKNREVLTNFLGVELSKSCKEQSKSMRSLGSNFFSKANNSKSQNYSQKTQQALEDDDWFKNI